MKKEFVIYAVNIWIDNRKADEWKKWMIDVHIPDVLETGLFENCSLSEILEPLKKGKKGYNIRYRLSGEDKLKRYQDQYADDLQRAHSTRYQGHYEAERRVYTGTELTID